MAAEPTNEQLREWLRRLEPWLNDQDMLERSICALAAGVHWPVTIRALLAAREELEKLKRFLSLIEAIDERDSQIADLRSAIVIAHGKGLSVNWVYTDAQTTLDLLVAECVTTRQERDAARAGEARLREAAEKTREFISQMFANKGFDTNQWEKGYNAGILSALDHHNRILKPALSSTADSAKWLEDRLIKAHNDAQVHMASAVAEAAREAVHNFRELLAKSSRVQIKHISRDEQAVDYAVSQTIAEAEQRGYERSKGEVDGWKATVSYLNAQIDKLRLTIASAETLLDEGHVSEAIAELAAGRTNGVFRLSERRSADA